MRAKRTGQHHAIHFFHPELIHQKPRAGIQRRLGHLDFANVAVGDGDPWAALCGAVIDQIGICAPIRKNIGRICLTCRPDQSGGVDNSVHAHLSDHFDNTRSANPGDPGAGNRLLKAVLI